MRCLRALGDGILELSTGAHTPAVRSGGRSLLPLFPKQGGPNIKFSRFFEQRSAGTLRGGEATSRQRFHLFSRIEDGHQFPIPGIRQQATGLLQPNPPKLINLKIGGEGPPSCLHDPIGHGLRAPLAVDVFGVPDEADEVTGKPGFLLHLSTGRLFESLARLELALGERPVLVQRPVDHRQLERPVLPADDQTTCRLDHIGWCWELRSHRPPRHAADYRCPSRPTRTHRCARRASAQPQ
jgi:hypothetical protein